VEGYVKIYLVLPSTIYGIASGVLVEKGIENPHSIQVPALIQASLERDRTGMVGQGLNLWPDVDIDDGRIFSMTTILPPLLTCSSGRSLPRINSIRTNPATEHGEGIYFGENGEHTMYEVGKFIGDALVALGKSDNAAPTTFSKEETHK
jgi:hypothetical protein